jgi:dihydrofolate reductase
MIAIAAMSRNRVIGAEGKLPWHLPEDLKFFKRTTLGHVMLMGRKTYDSIGKPLPGRETWVVSRSGEIPGVRVLRSVDEIVPPADGRKLFLVGGAQLYQTLLPQCTELYLTLVDRSVEGDAFFPPFEDLFEERELLFEAPEMLVKRYVRRS